MSTVYRNCKLVREYRIIGGMIFAMAARAIETVPEEHTII